MNRLWIRHNGFHVAICTIVVAPTLNRIPSMSYELVHIAFALIKFHGAKVAIFMGICPII